MAKKCPQLSNVFTILLLSLIDTTAIKKYGNTFKIPNCAWLEQIKVFVIIKYKFNAKFGFMFSIYKNIIVSIKVLTKTILLIGHLHRNY